MNEFLTRNEGHIRQLWSALRFLLFVLAIFVIILAVNAVKQFTVIGDDVPAMETISVTGEGEAFAQPDVARFTFSVIEEGSTVAEAQEKASQKENEVLEVLETTGIEDKDIKTTSYNLNPRYEYPRSICTEDYCPPSGRRTLVGYEVRETISVKVKDISNAGELLSQVGNTGVQNISGLTFEVDDEDAVLAEARSKAIRDAKEKAEKLADDLGVSLRKIIGFYENSPAPNYAETRFGLGGDAGSLDNVSAPKLPAGENRAISIVNIVYKID